MGRIAVVDADNRFVRWSDREEVHTHHLWHRSVQVVLLHPDGRMLLQQRHPDKRTWPGHWDMAVAGHVEEEDYPAGPDDALDRVYAEVAAREVREELGVEPALEMLGHCPPEPGVHYEQARLFRAVHPGPFVLQPEEVAAVQWVDPERLDRMLADPAVPTTWMLAWQVARLRALGAW